MSFFSRLRTHIPCFGDRSDDAAAIPNRVLNPLPQSGPNPDKAANRVPLNVKSSYGSLVARGQVPPRISNPNQEKLREISKPIQTGENGNTGCLSISVNNPQSLAEVIDICRSAGIEDKIAELVFKDGYIKSSKFGVEAIDWLKNLPSLRNVREIISRF
jgi:hypothetical protein